MSTPALPWPEPTKPGHGPRRTNLQGQAAPLHQQVDHQEVDRRLGQRSNRREVDRRAGALQENTRLKLPPVGSLHRRDSQTRRRRGPSPSPGATLQPPPTAGRVPGPRPTTRERARRAGRPRPTPSSLGTGQKKHQQFIGTGRPCQTVGSRNVNQLPETTGTKTTTVATRATRQPRPTISD